MLTIDWPGTPAEGWTDYIPMEWFAKVGRFGSFSHAIYNPGKSPLVARLSLVVEERSAILDYCGKHEKFKLDNGIEIGIIQILFADNKRKIINSMLWKDGEGNKEWIDAEAAFGISEEPVGDDEGNKRLAIHMRSERKPWLAVEKKRLSRDSSGRLACEVCGPHLNNIYDPKIAVAIYEVHHLEPVSGGPKRNTMDDLAILCPNCHRAIHRTKPMMSVEALKKRSEKSESQTFQMTHYPPQRPLERPGAFRYDDGWLHGQIPSL